MKRLSLLFLPIVLLLSACIKDDLDLRDLHTNPLDPDYDGPALIELVSDSTQIIYSGGQPVDTIVFQTVQLRTDLLPTGTVASKYITLVNTGQVFDYGATIQPISLPQYHHVVAGTTYCFKYQMKVQFSLTKAYTYCTTAQP